jgi:hypothetical protein
VTTLPLTGYTVVNVCDPEIANHRMAFTMNGSVGPNGAETSWYFECGPTTDYGLMTSTQDSGSGTDCIAVMSRLSDLDSQVWHSGGRLRPQDMVAVR